MKYTSYISNASKKITVIQKAYAIRVSKYHGLEFTRFIIVHIAYAMDKCEQNSSDIKIKYPKNTQLFTNQDQEHLKRVLRIIIDQITWQHA